MGRNEGIYICSRSAGRCPWSLVYYTYLSDVRGNAMTKLLIDRLSIVTTFATDVGIMRNISKGENVEQRGLACPRGALCK